MVAEEVSLTSSQVSEAIAASLRRLLMRLMRETGGLLESDPHSTETLDRILEYQAISETIAVFGTSLLALKDIEKHELNEAKDKTRASP